MLQIFYNECMKIDVRSAFAKFVTCLVSRYIL